ncbi:TadE/TadG family type IV pilus assembly protein [Stieleria varia]|nr:TadE family protein [Stieleria varia]
MLHRQPRSNRKNRKCKQRLGAAAVEFAIVANIMFMMMFTCMEFARMNMIRNLAQDAAYFAARHAIVPGATADEAIQVASDLMDSMVTTGYTVDVSPLGNDSENVVVTVTVDFDEVALFAPRFMPNATITTTANVKTERYDGFFEQ